MWAHLQPAELLSGKLIFLVGEQIPAKALHVELPGPVLAADRHAHYLQVFNGHDVLSSSLNRLA